MKLKNKQRSLLAKLVLGRKPGLTLIELAVVVMVLGMLIYILTSNITSTKDSVVGGVNKMKFSMDKAQLFVQLDTYKNKYGTYPDEGMGLRVLVEQVAGAPDGWEATIHNKEAILDPWKREYRYRLENGKPVVYSLGADGQEGGDGDNKDVYLNEQK